jgi:uncharacterized protein with LGFP repeats
MENSLAHSNDFLNPQQPLKVDDKQNLLPSILAINPVESTLQSSGSGLNYGVQETIDKWASKQPSDYSLSIGSSKTNDTVKGAVVSLFTSEAKTPKLHFAPQAITVSKLPVAIKKPADIVPTGLVINGVKSSYDVGSTLSIDPSFVVDGDGWKDVNKVDFWLTDSKGKRVELADVTSFVVKDIKDKNSAKFSYSTSLKGIVAGDYKLNAVAYDKFGAASNQFTQSIGIKTVYQIGFDSSTNKIDASVMNVFTKLNGVQILGKATNNIHSIAGGKVQDFEKGSIFQSAAGTFSLQGTLNNFYKDLSAADKLRLGMPTANETNVGGWHQSFQNGELQLVQGMPVKWSEQTLITDRYNLLGGANALGKSVGIIHDLNGGKVQDYEKGSIFAYGNKTVAVTGSIAAYYQANSATLGLPTSEESTTSYGKRQDFQGAVVTSSAQFGVHTLHGSVVGYYTGLTAAQKDQLGAATTEEAVGGDGNWQQFFRGGSVLWKSNGTGELKLTPFTVGSDGNSVNPVFTTEFNKVVGWEALGKATNNVHSINGGTVQDFEKGSIFQSGAGTFAVRGSIGIYYRANSATLLLPTSAEIATSYGWRQDFQGAVVTHSPQFGTHTLHGSVVGYYTGLTAAQKDQLGAATTEEAVGGDGNWQQFFKGGSVLWKSNGTGELKLTPFTIGSDGGGINPAFTTKFNAVVGWDSLGKATGKVRSIAGGTVQDFEKGSIFQSAKGTFVLDGILSEMYRQEYSSIGFPIGDKVSTVNGLRQDFENGTLISTATAQTFALKGGIASYYKVLNDTQLTALGAPISNVGDSNGGVSQYFKNGIVYSSSFGTFTIRGVFSERGNSRGVPLGEEKIAGDGLRQDFSEGSATYSAKAGIHEITGGLVKYYQGLTEAQKTQLGVAYKNTVSGGNNSFQFFQGGVIELNRNGTSHIRFTPAIGFDGNTFNEKFFDKYMSLENIDGLGDPISGVVNVNGILRQDFQKGFITQNGSVVEGKRTVYSVTEIESQLDAYWQKNSAILGSKFDPTSSAAHATKKDDGSYLIFYKDGYLTWKDGQITNGKVTNVIDLTKQNPSPGSGGVIVITNKPDPTPTPTPIQYTTEYTTEYHTEYTNQTRTVEVPAQNPLPSPVSPQYSQNSSLVHSGLNIRYQNFSGFVDSAIGLKLRPENPNRDYQPDRTASNGENLQFDAWTEGEFIDGNNIWFHVANSRDWVSAAFVRTGNANLQPEFHNANFQGIVNLSGRINFRPQPDTNLSANGGANYQEALNFDGWATGEPIGGNNIWYHVAGSSSWVSAYLIYGSPDRSVSPESTRPSTSTISESVPHQVAVQVPHQVPVNPGQGSQGTPTPVQQNDSSIPTNIWKAEYFNNNALNGSPTFTRQENQIDNNWGSGGPGNGIGNDNFSVRWQGQFPFEGGSYRFTNSVDDGMRIYVDNTLVHDTWNGRNTVTYNTDVSIPAGTHTIKIEYREDGGDAQAKFSLTKNSDVIPTPQPTQPTPSTPVNNQLFTGVVTSSIGLKWRQGAGTNYNYDNISPYNTTLQFDQKIAGESVIDANGNSNNQWYHIAGTNDWVSAAYINVSPTQSVTNPTYIPPTSTNNPPSPVEVTTTPIYSKDFYGVVMSTTGVNLRYSPHLADRSNDNEAYNKVLHFDAVTTGDSVVDLVTQKSDNQWYRIAGTNEWVPSGYINGSPDRSVTNPTYVPPTPTNNPSIPNVGSKDPIDYPNIPPILNLPERTKESKSVNVQGAVGNLWIVANEISYDVSSVVKISKDTFKKGDLLKLEANGSISLDSSAKLEVEKKLTSSIKMNFSLSLKDGIGVSFGNTSIEVEAPKLTPVWINTGTFSAKGSFSLPEIPLVEDSIFNSTTAAKISANLEVNGTYIDMSKLREEILNTVGFVIFSEIVIGVAALLTDGGSLLGIEAEEAPVIARASALVPKLVSAIQSVASIGDVGKTLEFLRVLALA